MQKTKKRNYTTKAFVFLALLALTVSMVFAAPLAAAQLEAYAKPTKFEKQERLNIEEVIEDLPDELQDKATEAFESLEAERGEMREEIRAKKEQMIAEGEAEGNIMHKPKWRWFFWKKNLHCRYADLNGDQAVDKDDLAIVVDAYGSEDCSIDNYWCELTDINRNSKVGNFDLGFVIRQYGRECPIEE